MGVPKIGIPQNGRFIMEHPIKMDDLKKPLFLETPTCKQRILGPNFFPKKKGCTDSCWIQFFENLESKTVDEFFRICIQLG